MALLRMPAQPSESAETPPLWSDVDPLRILKDHEFDQIFPESIRKISTRHWSPVNVCRMAAKLLVNGPATRVLDIGCGPGKFCIIGASTTSGHFTGVEQRRRLVRIARNALKSRGVPRVEIVHGNITEVDFLSFDAFYLFNPFEENVLPILRIDHEVEMVPELYSDYTAHVRRQLAQMPVGTRVVTYCGDCNEIPKCYEPKVTTFGGALILWVRQPWELSDATATESQSDRTRSFLSGFTEDPDLT